MHRCDPTRPETLLGGASRDMPPPERLLDLLPLRPALVIGDIGCGPGFLTLPLAARVPQGHVHAVDIAPTMCDTVCNRAAAGRAYITMHPARSGVVPLPPGCLDGALLTLAFLAIPVAERVAFLARLRTLVRPGGWLASLEWECRQNPGAGPPVLAPVVICITSCASPDALCCAKPGGSAACGMVLTESEGRMFTTIATAIMRCAGAAQRGPPPPPRVDQARDWTVRRWHRR